MISKELKNILEKDGGRLIIVENGKPEYAVMGFGEYERLLSGRSSVQALTEDELIAKINSDIALWKEGRQDAGEALTNEIEKLENLEYI